MLLLGLACSMTAGLADDISWTGGANTVFWDDATNWSNGVKPNSYTSNVFVNTNTSLASGYALHTKASFGLQSLNVNISQFTLTSTNTKTVRFAASDGALTFGSNYTMRGISTFNSSTPATERFMINALGDLLLRNDGAGEVIFNSAYLQSDNTSTAVHTFNVQGRGDWTFNANSYLGRYSATTASVDLHLQGGTNAFTGTFSYGATLAAQLRNLQVDSGTFKLNNSTVDLSGSAIINQGGTLTGRGIIHGDISMAGRLAASGGTLQTNALTLSATSEFAATIGHTAAESQIKALSGVTIDEGANLVLSLATGAPAIENGDLFFILINEGPSSINGTFTSLNGTTTNLGEGSIFEWNSNLWQITYSGNHLGNSFTGGSDIALRSIPEPASIFFLTLGTGALLVLRRRKT